MVASRCYSGFAIGLLLPFILGCSTGVPANVGSAPTPVVVASTAPNTPTHQTMLQPLHRGQTGIQGKVLQQLGDFMPQIKPSTAQSAPFRNRTDTVQTTIWIFSGRIPAQGTRWAISAAKDHRQFMGTVTSNADGEFSAQLPPGEYTVFAQYGDDLYLNAFQGDGSYATVQVEPGAATDVSLVNNERATF